MLKTVPGYKSPVDAADTFAFLRNYFPSIQYTNVSEDMQELWNAFIDEYPGDVSSFVDGWMGGTVDKTNLQKSIELARMLHIIYRWAKFGMPVFKLSEGLMSSLVMTDPSNVQCSEIKYPFPTFCITPPPGFWSFDDYPVTSIWVHNFKSSLIGSGRKPNMLHIDIFNADGVANWDNTAYGEREGICVPGEDSENTVANWLKRSEQANFFVSEPMHDLDFGLIQSTGRLIVNLMLYISEKGTGDLVSRKRKYTKRAKERSKQMEPEVWLMGSHIHMRPQVIEAARDIGGSGTPAERARWKLTKRIVVKGHWRRQPIGLRGSGQWKWKWIEPYPKGEGPRLTHIYEDKTKKNPPKDEVTILEERADEAAEVAEACYLDGLDAEGDFHSDRANLIFDRLEELTGKIYD